MLPATFTQYHPSLSQSCSRSSSESCKSYNNSSVLSLCHQLQNFLLCFYKLQLLSITTQLQASVKKHPKFLQELEIRSSLLLQAIIL